MRLLTLLGTGGTGKTRLALQAAADLRDDFEDRVYFVDLAASHDLDSVLSVTARTIGIREESNGRSSTISRRTSALRGSCCSSTTSSR